MPIEVVFFDVGFTLLFPNQEKTLAPLSNRGFHPTEAQLQAAERVAKQELDLLISQARKIDQQYWETYYGHLLRSLGVNDVSLRLELVSLTRTSSNWTRMLPGTTDVLESMKLFLDVENIVHVLALDKEVVDRGVSMRYEKFTFFKDRGTTVGAEYLDKMIQMPVYLYPLHVGQIEAFIKALDRSENIIAQPPLLKETLSPNPRKIKRLLNMLAWTNFSLDMSEDVKDFDRSVTTA